MYRMDRHTHVLQHDLFSQKYLSCRVCMTVCRLLVSRENQECHLPVRQETEECHQLVRRKSGECYNATVAFKMVHCLLMTPPRQIGI